MRYHTHRTVQFIRNDGSAHNREVCLGDASKVKLPKGIRYGHTYSARKGDGHVLQTYWLSLAEFCKLS